MGLGTSDVQDATRGLESMSEFWVCRVINEQRENLRWVATFLYFFTQKMLIVCQKNSLFSTINPLKAQFPSCSAGLDFCLK